jgi:hypothetical protein
VQLLRGTQHLGQEGGVCVFHIADLHVRPSNAARPLHDVLLSFTANTHKQCSTSTVQSADRYYSSIFYVDYMCVCVCLCLCLCTMCVCACVRACVCVKNDDQNFLLSPFS